MASGKEITQKFGVIIAVLALETGVRTLPRFASPLATTLVLRLLQLLVMALILRGQFTEGELGAFTPKALRQAVIRAAIWSAGFGTLVGAAALALAQSGINPLALVHMRLPRDPATLALFFVTGGMVAPIAEELFFRGVLYRLLRPLGIFSAVLITTLLFAAAHSTHGMVPVTQLAGGVLFAVAFEKEGHVAVPILIHGAGNTALFTLSLI